jgi:uncharacterized protein YkwD
MEFPKRLTARASTVVAVTAAVALLAASPADADNKRLNEYTYSGIYGAHQLNSCTDVDRIRRLRTLDDAARLHALDVLNTRSLDGDIGSDGSTPQDRAAMVGYHGVVGETVAINPALAISNLEVMQRWFNDPATLGVMQDCKYTDIGVWSENALDRTVVVAMYGQPADPNDVAPDAAYPN